MLRKPCGNNCKERQINKNALDPRKLDEATNQKKSKNAKMNELISKISRKFLEGKDGENLVAKLDFDYSYGQTRNLCIFTVRGGEFTGNYRFLKGLLGLADIPTIFQKWIDETLEFKHPALLKDT